MANAGVIAVLLGALWVLYKAAKDFFLNRDANQAKGKVSLLDTVIESKSIDIAKDEERVKQAEEQYENYKRNRKPSDNN